MVHKTIWVPHRYKQMLYGVKMEKSHWRFQLYLFNNDLDPEKEPETKVIITCIYRVRPSGNQTKREIRMTAEMYRTEYPLAYSS